MLCIIHIYIWNLVAFADDLMLLTRGACKMETEHYTNQDLKKLRDGLLTIK